MFGFISNLSVAELSFLILCISVILFAVCEIVLVTLYIEQYFFLKKLLKQNNHDGRYERKRSAIIQYLSNRLSEIKPFFVSSKFNTVPDVINQRNVDLADLERYVAMGGAKDKAPSNEELNDMRPDVAEEFLYNLDGKRSESVDTYMEGSEKETEDTTINQLRSIINKASLQIISNSTKKI